MCNCYQVSLFNIRTFVLAQRSDLKPMFSDRKHRIRKKIYV